PGASAEHSFDESLQGPPMLHPSPPQDQRDTPTHLPTTAIPVADRAPESLTHPTHTEKRKSRVITEAIITGSQRLWSFEQPAAVRLRPAQGRGRHVSL
ncbi:MAG: hypothetical protein LC776_10685, partial [Acidobacteria bacterium]|nr:hypothetical protein [Acidobacteriota bacterium]